MGSMVYNKKSNDNDIWDDTELIKMYEDSIKVSSSSSYKISNGNAQSSTASWKIGDKCTALFEEDGLWYPATILNISDNQVEIEFEFYGDVTWMNLSDIGTYATAEEDEPNETSDVTMSTPSENPSQPVTADSSFPPRMNTNSALPLFAPPPPPVFDGLAMPDQVEALSSMLMSWYMSGYHTGCYVTMQNMSKKNGD